jgi:hypothetical protein
MHVARWCTRILSRRPRIPADIRAEVDEAEIERLAWTWQARPADEPGGNGMAELKR